DRLSIVAKTVDNQYIVTPDNGTLTHVLQNIGIREVREIDEIIHRLPHAGESYTFHGRDVYAYTGARLAANVIQFEDVGRKISIEDVVELVNPDPVLKDNTVYGTIDILDVRFGNLWTNIDRELFVDSGVVHGELFEVTIEHNNRQIYK